MSPAEFQDLWQQVSRQPVAPLDDPAFGSGGALDLEIIARARHLKSSLFDGAVQAIAPLYVSSICKERCTYCNYRAGSNDPSLRRTRLSLDELRREVEFLVESRPLRAVELVYASDPQLTPDDLCRHVELTSSILQKHGASTVGLSAEPMSVAGYRRLRGAGLTFSVVWMETYDQVRYAACHPGSHVKTDFFYRLDSYERMLEAGLDGVGYGVLGGLGPWRRDWSMLILHQRWLRRHCGRGPDIVGIPRLKHAPGSAFQQLDAPPADSQFRALVALHNSLFPQVRPFVSTREDFDMCLQLASGGGCLFTFNCSTVPGGYTLPNRGAQFTTGDYDALLFAPRVRAAGHRVLWDWRPQPCYTDLV